MRKTTLKGRKKKVKLAFTGEQDDVLVGSHGDTDIAIKGDFKIFGTLYCPKFTVTLEIRGTGRIAFQGKCDRIIIKKMQGDCTLDLSAVTYKELHCRSLEDKSVVIAGKARAITPAILSGQAILRVNQRQLIFNPVTSGSSQILTMVSESLE